MSEVIKQIYVESDKLDESVKSNEVKIEIEEETYDPAQGSTIQAPSYVRGGQLTPCTPIENEKNVLWDLAIVADTQEKIPESKTECDREVKVSSSKPDKAASPSTYVPTSPGTGDTELQSTQATMGTLTQAEKDTLRTKLDFYMNFNSPTNSNTNTTTKLPFNSENLTNEINQSSPINSLYSSNSLNLLNQITPINQANPPPSAYPFPPSCSYDYTNGYSNGLSYPQEPSVQQHSPYLYPYTYPSYSPYMPYIQPPHTPYPSHYPPHSHPTHPTHPIYPPPAHVENSHPKRRHSPDRFNSDSHSHRSGSTNKDFLLCHNYAKHGECRFEDRCFRLHIRLPANICFKYLDTGYCPFNTNCRFQHMDISELEEYAYKHHPDILESHKAKRNKRSF
ncbi:MAG: hypothetical protein Sylvanvirus9_29 [Sylvanvirus sp.]|uniref:C3H1-type domain-containing protein n=1 Tax=Sylvanvirus sp. TaxID=2487774 RepID=A0A3G5ALF0_9VIRU|nr:MAG: hypothetical protein Sylvanvirus9_29 [Sylvanvirus sp.]